MTASKMSFIPPERMSEFALKRRLRLTLGIMGGIIVFSLLALFVFAPQVGSFFGFFSKHRNEEAYKPTAKPTAPVFTNAPEAVNTENITLSGRALSGTTIKIYVNGPEKATTTTGADGIFSFADLKLSSGKNMIFAKAFDDKGNESDNSEYLIVNYDKESPKIELTTPKDGDTVRNLNKRIEIIGKLDEKAVITVNGKTAIQKPDLSFDFWLGTEEGTIKIKIIATDIAGNKTEKEITVKYVKG
jgi:hypothetical protein